MAIWTFILRLIYRSSANWVAVAGLFTFTSHDAYQRLNPDYV